MWPDSLRSAVVAVLVAAWPALAGPTMRSWSVPSPLSEVAVSDQVVVGGMPVGIHALRSKAKVEVVMDDLRRQFIAAGLYLPPARHSPQLTAAPQLTGYDPETKVAYTVFFQVNPDRTTTALFTEAAMDDQLRATEKVTFAPMMPAATQVLLSHTEGMHAVAYRVKATATEVSAFYAEAVPKAGFKKTGEGRWATQDEVLQLFVRPLPGDQVSVSVTRGPGAAAVQQP